jgi:hypothetical protein
MNAGRPILILSGALLLAALAAGALVAAGPMQPSDRHRSVQGWRVEDRDEEDGGRLVRIARTSGPYRLEYQAAFWHGNDGIIQRVSALGENCGADEELDRHLIFPVGEIRNRLAAALAQCAAPPRAVRAALRGLEPAYQLALAWNRDAVEAAAAAAGPIDEPEDATANAACDSAEERDITEMNTTEATHAEPC